MKLLKLKLGVGGIWKLNLSIIQEIQEEISWKFEYVFPCSKICSLKMVKRNNG